MPVQLASHEAFDVTITIGHGDLRDIPFLQVAIWSLQGELQMCITILCLCLRQGAFAQGMKLHGHARLRGVSPAAEVALLSTVDILRVGGLEEAWMQDETSNSSLRSWRLLHPAAHGICIFTLNKEDFYDPYPRLWDHPLPYGLANSYSSISYALLHGYDYLRVRLPE